MTPATLDTYAKLYTGDYMSERWLWRAEGVTRFLRKDDHILEVGAGRGQLADCMRASGWKWHATDPIPGPYVAEAKLPCIPMPWRTYDAVVSIDVLEHIEPDHIADALREMRRLAPRAVCAVANMSDIHVVDGVPTELHLIQRPPAWWAELVEALGGRATTHPTDTDVRFWLQVDWGDL